MQKYDYLNRLIKTNCVVVVRGNDAAEAVKTVDAVIAGGRSEERRVGKECSSECRSRWSPYH